MHLAPGDPTALFTDPSVKPQELLRIRANWGLDKPIWIQYFYWLGNALKGDFGTAYLINRPVTHVIAERLPATLLLTGVSLVITILIAIPLGVISAFKKNKLFDNVVTILSFIGMAMPSFWLALMLMLLFSVQFKILPATGMIDPLLKTDSALGNFVDICRHLILPASTMVMLGFAGITRYTRGSMLEVLGQNYIRTARAKGLPERVVLFKHALKNALLPLITLLGMIIPDIFAGAFIIETVFAWPGMGRLGVSAIFSRNYPVVMGVIMLSAILIVLGNLLADICYAIADPRIRLDE
jgi:peptide/nickel transport system permease protein